MARPRTRRPLDIYLNSRLVGRLHRQASGAIDFRYDDAWLAWEHALPISLSLPLREDRYIGEAVAAVFDNLLPDSDQVRRRMAERLRAEGHDAFNLLAAAGRDCVGALQFLPEDMEPGPAGEVHARPVTDGDIRRIVRDLGRNPLGVDAEGDFRISLAGAQEKTALLFWNGRWHIPQGTTATTHILKPPIGRLGDGIDLSRSVENELFCMRLAKAAGLPAAEVQAVDFEGQRVLVVERFDRRWTADGRLLRLPQEDGCQALGVPPVRKCESDGGPGIRALLNLLKGSDDPAADQEMLLRAQIFFWLVGATDGHAKNVSVFLMPGGRFRLAPLYDILSAQPNLDAGELTRSQMKLAMAVGDERHYVLHTVMPRHFVQTAAPAGFVEARVRALFEELLATLPAALDKTLASLPPDFPAPLAESIANGLRQRSRRMEQYLMFRQDS